VEKIKQILHYLSSMLLYALLMILAVIVLMVVITIGDRVIALKNHQSRAPLFSAYVIISPSMVPNINVYDAVITARVPQNRIGVYDIITFLSKEIETHGVPITHRVVGILKTEDGERAYRTKGDNNNKEDKAIILQSEVIGKVLFRIPMLGYVRTFVTSKIGFFISVVLPITASLFLEIWRFIHKRREKLQEKPQDDSQLDSMSTVGQETLPTVLSPSLGNVEPITPVVPIEQHQVISPPTMSESGMGTSSSIIPSQGTATMSSTLHPEIPVPVQSNSPSVVSSVNQMQESSTFTAPSSQVVKPDPKASISSVEPVKVENPVTVPITVAPPIAPVQLEEKNIIPSTNSIPINSISTVLPVPSISVETKSNISQENPIKIEESKNSLQSESEVINDILTTLDQDSSTSSREIQAVETSDDDDIEII